MTDFTQDLPFRVRITADGVTLWVASGVDNMTFSENEKDAEEFKNTFGEFARYVLPELEAAPFVSGIVENPEDHEGEGFLDRGLENIEFVYKTG